MPTRAGRSRRIDVILRCAAFTAAFLLGAAGLTSAAHAQSAYFPPTYVPVPSLTDNNATLASGAALIDLGTVFLRRAGNEATWGANAANRNPGGGGAGGDLDAPSYRTWAETYGLWSRTGPQGEFIGDRRRTVGGVAGFAVTSPAGVTVGVSVDQSHTNIDMPQVFQSAGLDLTQVGINANYTKGPWTFAFAAVHGFADIDSHRLTLLGDARGDYSGRVDGAIGEISYAFDFGQARIVPKASLQYVAASTDAFRESSGFLPVGVGRGAADRTTVLLGSEVGHYWIIGQNVLDISGYGKFVDNVSQNIDAVTVSLGPSSIAIQGVRESRYGADAGASVSFGATRNVRLYANYDGKFRDGFTSHQATAGIEYRW